MTKRDLINGLTRAEELIYERLPMSYKPSAEDPCGPCPTAETGELIRALEAVKHARRAAEKMKEQ